MEINSELISKFNNIFIMLHYAIMTNDIERVKHFLSPEMYEKYKKIVDSNISNNEIQMYDELNVKNTEILEYKDFGDHYQVVVRLVSRYMDYIVDLETGKYKRGINDHRIEKNNILVFEKIKNHISNNGVITCFNCGANLNVTATGVCPYCDKIIDLSGIDYQLISME